MPNVPWKAVTVYFILSAIWIIWATTPRQAIELLGNVPPKSPMLLSPKVQTQHWSDGRRWMGLVDAGSMSRLDRHVGYFESYAESHEALDREYEETSAPVVQVC